MQGPRHKAQGAGRSRKSRLSINAYCLLLITVDFNCLKPKVIHSDGVNVRSMVSYLARKIVDF